MSFVYIRSEPGLWTVGHYDGGQWEPESDHGSESEAAERTAWLNGAPMQVVPNPDVQLREFAEWLVSLDEVEGPGAEARRTVTLTQIIQKARAALGSSDEYR
jgi:hypothetical protein